MKLYNGGLILFILIIILLSGCTTLKDKDLDNKINTIVEDTFKQEVVFPTEEDLQECSEFPLLTSQYFNDVSKWIVEVAAQEYYKCANKAKVNQDIIKKIYKKENK